MILHGVLSILIWPLVNREACAVDYTTRSVGLHPHLIP